MPSPLTICTICLRKKRYLRAHQLKTIEYRMRPLFRLKHDDTKRLTVCGILFLFGSLVIWVFIPVLLVPASVFMALILGSLCVAHYYREANEQRVHLLKNVQDLQFLHTHLPLRKPLPYFAGWSASPALAARLYSLVKAERPKRILELGSGASTVVMAYALEELGEGQLTSLDHDAQYAEGTRKELARHNLGHIAEVQTAPLTSVGSNGHAQKWYDISMIDPLGEVDLLVIDGPPRHTGKNARLPAFEHLRSALSPHCIVVLDDTIRPDEDDSLKAWTSISDPVSVEDIACEKGVAVRRLI